MIGAMEFSLTLVGILILWMLWALRGVNLKAYFATDTGKGIAKGIGLAVSFTLIFAAIGLLTGCAGTYFNDASVFGGLDYTKKQSPQCEPVGVDSHTTSNLGLRGNIYQSQDERFRTNLKYTHHSCAFSPDDRQYDAIGLEAEYKFWIRQ